MKRMWGVSLAALAFMVCGAQVTVTAADNANQPTNCVRIKNKCKLQVKQTKWGFQFGGIDFNSGQVKKVGSVSLNTDLIQKLTDIAQILDQMQFSRCQILNATTTCDSARQGAIVASVVGNEQLGELAMLAEMYSGDSAKLEDALLKWIVQSSDLLQKVYAKQFMAADQQTTTNIKKTRDALEYAVGKLNIAPGSPQFQRILQDPIKATLQ